MLAGLVETLRRTVGGIANGRPVARRLTSWMGVFRVTVIAHACRDLDELASLVRSGPYCCIGKSHSYNGVQLVPGVNAIMLAESGLTNIAYDPSRGTVRVGASVTIEALKRYLLSKGRRMLSSGNYMQQTVVGAIATGTHGYGAGPVMADAVESLVIMKGNGAVVELRRGDPEFGYAALSFGVVAPIVEVELRTAALESFRSDAWITTLSQKEQLAAGAEAVSFAVLPYSPSDDPTVMLHTLRPAEPGDVPVMQREPILSLRRLADFVIRHYWLFDRLFSFTRRPIQRFVARLEPRFHRRVITDPSDLDYLYDPVPGLAAERPPDLLQGFFSTTHTSYNLAFFVALEDAPRVLRFIMNEAESLRGMGFYLKSLIGVRELKGMSELPFAATFRGPVAAIDLFSDPRDYAWLERLQREVLAYYPDARPHWGKSAIVEEFRTSLGEDHLRQLLSVHKRHYPQKKLMLNEQVRRLLDIGEPLIETSQGQAAAQSSAALVASTRGAATNGSPSLDAPAEQPAAPS